MLKENAQRRKRWQREKEARELRAKVVEKQKKEAQESQDRQQQIENVKSRLGLREVDEEDDRGDDIETVIPDPWKRPIKVEPSRSNPAVLIPAAEVLALRGLRTKEGHVFEYKVLALPRVKSPKLHIHSLHRAEFVRGRRFCDECREDLAPGDRFLNCDNCQYDLCVKCEKHLKIIVW